MIENFEQIPISAIDFAQNPEERCPVVLLLDTSVSMAGKAMDEMNAGIEVFKNELMSDNMAVKRVEVQIISFGPVKVESEFQTVDAFTPPKLMASGHTPMGRAIELAIENIKQRKEEYKENGIPYKRPWVFMITDGAPSDQWERAAALIAEGEENKSFMFFAVGVEKADMEVLKKISVREPLKLKDLRFSDLFMWLSSSLSSVSKSQPGDIVGLENPVAPDGWAIVG